MLPQNQCCVARLASLPTQVVSTMARPSFSLDKQHAVLNVVGVTHYTNRLFSFKTNRPKAFRFKAGEFVMIGLIVNGKPVFRAYSICSAS